MKMATQVLICKSSTTIASTSQQAITITSNDDNRSTMSPSKSLLKLLRLVQHWTLGRRRWMTVQQPDGTDAVNLEF